MSNKQELRNKVFDILREMESFELDGIALYTYEEVEKIKSKLEKIYIIGGIFIEVCLTVMALAIIEQFFPGNVLVK